MNTALATKFNSTFQAAAVKYDASLAAKPAKDLHPEVQKMLAANFAGLPTGGIETGIVTACAAWPRIRQFLNIAIKVTSFWPSYRADAALAKGWLEAFNTDIVPEICGPQK